MSVGRHVALFATRGAVCRARGVVVSQRTPHGATGPPNAPGGANASRSLTIAHGKKKGFAEMLGDLAAPKKEALDFQGRPRLAKGKVSAKQHVPPEIAKPPYADSGFLPDMNERIQTHNEEQIAKMRKAGRLAAEVLDFAESIAKPGVTTDYIDQKVHKMIIEHGAYPSPLNYGGFPKSVCTSLNECICHGIPDDTVLMDGDIVNIDVTVFLDGHHGDTSRTVLVGNVSDEVRALCKATDVRIAFPKSRHLRLPPLPDCFTSMAVVERKCTTGNSFQYSTRGSYKYITSALFYL